MPFRSRNLRARLTYWYVMVFGAILVLYVAGTSAFVYLGLRESLDDDLGEDIERIEPHLEFADGTLRVSASPAENDDPDRRDALYVEILSPDGRILYRNEKLGGLQLGAAPFQGEGVSGYSGRSLRLSDGTRVRLASRLHQVGNRTVLIRIARSEDRLREEMGEVLSVLLLGLPAALALAAFAGYGFARRILAPLGTITKRAQQITAENLNERLPIENADDELGQLARVFNETLARLELSFDRLRRFTSDASHELRTPLTAIRSVGEVGLQRGGVSGDYRDVIGSMLEETNRLTRVVESLLTLTRADAGTVQLQRVPLSLLAVARDSAVLLDPLAEEKHQRLNVTGDASVMIEADRLFLRQAALNLIDNAIKYSPEGGTISVSVRRESGEAVLEVADQGPGIPPEHRDRIFDRFYRLDPARSRESGGAGLGLAITRWAVEAHGGLIAVLPSNHHCGATFRITLPICDSGKIAAVDSAKRSEENSLE